MQTKYPSKKALKEVTLALERGEDLTLEHVGKVFGPDFWMLVVYCFMDAQDAARAIAGSIKRLSQGEQAGEV